jgi:hypothetical protein
VGIVPCLLSSDLGSNLATIVLYELSLLDQLAKHLEVVKADQVKQLFLDLLVFLRRQHNLKQISVCVG